MKKIFVGIYFCWFFSQSLIAQNKQNIIPQNIVWYTLIETIQINKNWFFVGEVHERHFISPLAQHQFVVRTRLHREIGQGWNISGGFTVFLNSPNNPRSPFSISPELRPHLALAYRQVFSWMNLNHRYKAEARYMQNSNNDFYFHSIRYRYQIQAEIPILKILNKDKEWLWLKIGDEIMVSSGPQISRNVFDQNRIYLAGNIRLNPATNLEIGYMNSFQQLNSGDDFYDRDIIRVILFHRVSLKK